MKFGWVLTVVLLALDFIELAILDSWIKSALRWGSQKKRYTVEILIFWFVTMVAGGIAGYSLGGGG